MLKVVDFDKTERLITRTLERDPDTAMAELSACTTAVTDSLRDLAKAFPHCVVVAAIANAEPRGVFVVTGSRQGDLFSPVAPDRARTWARIIARMPDEFLSTFQTEFEAIRKGDGTPGTITGQAPKTR